MSEKLPEDLTFENALGELEHIVNLLEEGDLTLEKSVELFERGQQLTTFCQQALDSAELRVRQVGEAQ